MTTVRGGLAACVVALWVVGCGGGSAPEAAPPVGSGTYRSEIYGENLLKPTLNQAYSVRPNSGGEQYTSDLKKPSELGSDTLTLDMDIWVPPNASASSRKPAIVWIHGGGLTEGGKERHRVDAISYARAGYVAASINYRLTPDNKRDPDRRTEAFRQASEDVMNAIRYLKANAARYGIDTSRMATIGASAGGGLALINAVEFDTLDGTVNDYPGVSSKTAAAVTTGATLSDEDISIDLFLSFDAADTPVQLFHARPQDGTTGSTWDEDVVSTQNLIVASGNVCETVPTPNLGHVVDLSVGGAYWGNAWPFLSQYLNLP